MQRNTIIAITTATAVLLAGLGFLVWKHVTDLGDQLTRLSHQVDDLGSQVVTAEERATLAEERAARSEQQASAAAESAEEAMAREEQSAEEARQSAEEARAAATARTQAEEEARLAAAARTAAEQQALESEIARGAAEEKLSAAEEESAEALQKAATAREEARRARAEAEELKRKREEDLNRLQGALSRIAETRRTALGVVLNLDSSQIEFDFNKADLRPANRELLSRIAGVLLTFENYGIQVFGHTDNIGSADYNPRPSEQRAQVVRDYLAEAGIDPDVMSTMGLGKSSPLVEASDPESRQRNRRVEVAIVFSEGDFEAITPEDA